MIDTLVIGAGITGLSIAHKLIERGENVIILEKSKGVGGRIATRRIEEKGFDHGALYIPKEASTIQLLTDLQLPYISDNHQLHICGGMNKLPKKFSEGLTIHKSQKVSGLSFEKNWIVKTEEGESFESKKIILTAPMPQSLELLGKNRISYPTFLKQVTYTKALLLLLIADSVKLKTSGHSLTSMSERELHPRGFVLRASNDFSERYFENSDQEIQELLLSLIEVNNLTHSEVKKWRYVQPEKAVDMPFIDLGQQLFLAGDSFNSPDLAGSLKSASLLFKHLYP